MSLRLPGEEEKNTTATSTKRMVCNMLSLGGGNAVWERRECGDTKVCGGGRDFRGLGEPRAGGSGG